MTTIHHELTTADRAAVEGMRRTMPPTRKGAWGRPESRAAFDALLERTPAATGVTYEKDRVGGIAGWWCRPAGARREGAILHVHGGGFVVGSAKACRHFAGQVAVRAGVDAFVAEYRLTPEHPFPAALEDVERAYAALADATGAVAVVGDSAGGNLALALLGSRPAIPPRAAVAFSPWTDLANTAATIRTRADADPYLTAAGLEASAARYLRGHDPRDPRASPLYGDLAGLPPVLIHVGDDEILLDDALRYARRHADCTVHVWSGMPHVFPANLGLFHAAELALADVGTFLRARMGTT